MRNVSYRRNVASNAMKRLPEISSLKKRIWKDNLPYELKLFDKSKRGESLTKKEDEEFDELVRFYKHQIEYFKKIKLKRLNKKDLENLAKHFNNVFNISFLFTNDIHSNTFYRAVVNKELFNSNCRIYSINYLAAPPLDIIKCRGTYGRANTSNSTMFYASLDEGAMITELQNIAAGDLITISEWKQIKSFNILPIVYDDKFKGQAEYIFKTKEAFELTQKNIDLRLHDLIRTVLTFLSYEFSKVVKKPNEYLFSANFSNNMFKIEKSKSEPSFVGLVYPGVACDYKNFNIALEPDLIGDKIKLVSVKEIVVTKKYNFRKDHNQVIDSKLNGVAEKIKNRQLIWNN
jgi:hypothetical protein